jgi:putative transcriptional regulator
LIPVNKVKELRESRKISQEQLAVACGITRVTLAKIEGQGADPKLSQMVRISEELDYTIGEVFGV